MSRKVLLAQYGAEPIILDNHDPLFEIICTPRNTSIRNKESLSTQITFSLNDETAAHLASRPVQVGLRLLKHHKLQLCWFVLGHVGAKGKGHAMPAVEKWLTLHDVDESEYGTDSAYKLFQRFGWNFDKKNRLFGGRLRGKPGAEMTAKKRARAKLARPVEAYTYTWSDIAVELAVSRFLAAYTECFRHLPKFLPTQARMYAYVKMQSLSTRDIARKLHRSQATVWGSLHSLQNRMHRNPTIARLMQEAIALPEKV